MNIVKFLRFYHITTEITNLYILKQNIFTPKTAKIIQKIKIFFHKILAENLLFFYKVALLNKVYGRVRAIYQ